MKFRQKQRLQKGGSNEHGMATDDSFRKRHPALHEYLTCAPEETGHGSMTATLTIFTEGFWWKLCLNDRAEGMSCFASAETLSEALETLDSQLQEGTADWKEQKNKRR